MILWDEEVYYKIILLYLLNFEKYAREGLKLSLRGPPHTQEAALNLGAGGDFHIFTSGWREVTFNFAQVFCHEYVTNKELMPQ